MSTSTSNSKNQKLYDYLEGYEIAGFTGCDPHQMYSSISKLMNDLIDSIYSDDAEQIKGLVNNKVLNKCHSYVKTFYRKIQRLTKPENSRALADSCKQDYNFLRDLVDVFSTMDSNAIAPIYCGIIKSNDDIIDMDLCNKCPWYLSQKQCRIAIVFDRYKDATDETEEVGISHIFNFKPSAYIAEAILSLFNGLIKQLKISYADMHNYSYLFQTVLSFSTLFQLMNPTGSVREEILNESIENLTGPQLDKDCEVYKESLQTYKEVIHDIHEGKKPYIRDISKALIKYEAAIKAPYNTKTDMYLSMRGTGQKHFTGLSISVISSVLEIDPYKDDPAVLRFDSMIKYVSPYLSFQEAAELLMVSIDDLKSKWKAGIRTILINNPSKFKPRIIHIHDNPIQDRMKYLQNILNPFIRSLPSDSSKDHELGREFVQQCTLAWALSDPEDRQLNCTTDFDNSTDFIDFEYQHMVFTDLFGEEVGDFIDYCNHLPSIVELDGKIIDVYTATTGNKQGMEGSFSILSICHHVAMRMLAKHFHKESIPARVWYRIAGDDCHFTSFGESELNYYDADDPIMMEGIPRSTIEVWHFQNLRYFTGFRINHSKSVSTHWTDSQCRAEFCKVTYCNGVFVSPWPVRLAMNYSSSLSSKIALAIWMANRRITDVAKPFMRLIVRDEQLYNIIRSGDIPYLSDFEEETDLTPTQHAAIRYCYGLSALGTNFLSILSPDKVKEKFRIDQYDLKGYINQITRLLKKAERKINLDKLDIDHKINQFILENSEITDLMSEIFEFGDSNDRILAILTSPMLQVEDEVLDVIYKLVTTRQLLLLAKKGGKVDWETFFPDFPLQFSDKVQSLSNKLLPRSLTQRPASEVVILEGIYNLYKDINRILS